MSTQPPKVSPETPEPVVGTEGEMQRWVEEARRQLHQLHRHLYMRGVLPANLHTAGKRDRRYDTCKLFLEVSECLEVVETAMIENWGSTVGGICPYDDCAHELAFREPGWWTCPACLKELYAELDKDGEYLTGEARDDNPAKPELVPFARDLGPSWTSP